MSALRAMEAPAPKRSLLSATYAALRPSAIKARGSALDFAGIAFGCAAAWTQGLTWGLVGSMAACFVLQWRLTE